MSKRTVLLQRTHGDENQTSGVLSVLDESGWPVLAVPCIERGWRDNQPNVSCVPPGVYRLALEYSPRFDADLWELKDVPGRTECKIHVANQWHQLNGCIAPGLAMTWFDSSTPYHGVAQSRAALNSLHQALSELTETTIDIRTVA